MPKNDSPCDRAREIARAVYTFAVQPGNWEKLRKQAEAFIPEAAKYRQRLRQGHGNEGEPWTGRTPSLAAKCALLAALHDQCSPHNRLLEPAAPDGGDDGAWWVQASINGWIRPALKGDDSRSAQRLGMLQAFCADVEEALAERARLDKGHGTREQPWREEASEYLPLSEARKLIDDRLTLPALSKLCKPDGEMRYMRKTGRGCKVHLGDFRQYMKSRQSDPKWAKAFLTYLNAAGKGDMRYFWTCTVCDHEYPENGTATAECPKCGGEAKIGGKRPPEPRM